MKNLLLGLAFLILLSSLASCASGKTGGWKDAQRHQKTGIARHRQCGH